MSRYLIVIQQNATSRFTAFAPDLPICTATGASRGEVEGKIRAVIEFYIRSQRASGGQVSPPLAEPAYCEVKA